MFRLTHAHPSRRPVGWLAALLSLLAGLCLFVFGVVVALALLGIFTLLGLGLTLAVALHRRSFTANRARSRQTLEGEYVDLTRRDPR